MRIILIISLFFFGFTPDFHAQKKRKGKSAEQIMQEQAKDDLIVFSQQDYPYLEKFHEAIVMKFSGNITEAKRLLKECLAEKPNDDAVLFALGEIAKNQNIRSEALSHFQAAQKIDPENRYYTQEIAFLQFEKADFKNAAINFKQLVEWEPRHVEWIYAYGQTLLYNQDYEGAIKAFNQMEDQIGPIPEVTMIKIDLYRDLGKPELIEHDLLKLKKTFPGDLDILKAVIGYYEEEGQGEKAISLIRELVEQDPENRVAHFILAKNAAEKKDFTEFMNSLPIVMASGEIQLHDKMLLTQHFDNIKEGFNEEKMKALDALVSAHPTEARAHAMRAEIYNNQGKTREAIRSYRKALEKDNAEFRLWTSVLAIESAYKEYQALYEDAKEAISYFPTLPFVYYAASEGALQLNKLEEATEFLNQGELYIIDDKAQTARFAMRYGEIEFAQGNVKKGIEQFEKALKIDGESILINATFALSLANANTQLEKAEKLLLPFLKEDQTHTTFFTALTTVYLKKKEYQKAINLLKHAIENVEYKAEMYDLLGDVYMLSGDVNSAIDSWSTARLKESRNVEIDKKMNETKYYAPRYY
jgi:tetratricopeptide (TPR) repeat protein